MNPLDVFIFDLNVIPSAPYLFFIKCQRPVPFTLSFFLRAKDIMISPIIILSYEPAALSPSIISDFAAVLFACDGDTIGIPFSLANDLAANNYQFTYANGSMTVNRRAITVTAADKSKTYGDANPTLTYTITGYKNSENATSAGITGAESSNDYLKPWNFTPIGLAANAAAFAGGVNAKTPALVVENKITDSRTNEVLGMGLVTIQGESFRTSSGSVDSFIAMAQKAVRVALETSANPSSTSGQ